MLSNADSAEAMYALQKAYALRDKELMAKMNDVSVQEPQMLPLGAPKGSWMEGAEFKRWGAQLCAPNGRYHHAAVSHGRKVIVFGGSEQFGASDTVEVLDLDDEEAGFKASVSMSTARAACAAVRLDARRVLVVGGHVDIDEIFDTTEVLDCDTMAFAAGPRMLSKRQGCVAVLLDSEVLVVGGWGDEDESLRTTEILDVATMTFRAGPEMQSARSGCAAVRLDARRVLVVGGCDDADDSLETTEILDVSIMTSSAGPSMREPRHSCAAVLLKDEQSCLVIGGASVNDVEVTSTEVLDLETMEFTGYGPHLRKARMYFAAVVVEEQRIVVLGGMVQPAGPRDEQIRPETEILQGAVI